VLKAQRRKIISRLVALTLIQKPPVGYARPKKIPLKNQCTFPWSNFNAWL